MSTVVKNNGEMAEWLKAHAWKACIRESVSRVRIPISPPFLPLKKISSKIKTCTPHFAFSRTYRIVVSIELHLMRISSFL